MNCPSCNKVIPITKVLQSKDDAVICVYCNSVIPAEMIAWKDGVFHFDILGDVKTIKVNPRVLLKDQRAPMLDFTKILDKAKKIIKSEPNINCICSEFFIADDDIRVELILEPK